MENLQAISSVSWLVVGLVLVATWCLVAGFAFAKRRYTIHPEVPRKAVHVMMALLFLPMPWLINSVLPAAALTLGGLGFLICLRMAGRRGWGIGQVIHHAGNRPKGMGDIVFPLGPFVVWYWSQGNPLLYCLPILYLAISDPVACLVGTLSNKKTHDDASRRKTWQGSAAFFVSTFVCTFALLTVFSKVPFPMTILVALLMGSALGFVEALSFFGLDNFTIPVLGHLLLRHLLIQNPTTLSTYTVLLALLSLIFLARRLRPRGTIQSTITIFLLSTSMLLLATGYIEALHGRYACIG